MERTVYHDQKQARDVLDGLEEISVTCPHAGCGAVTVAQVVGADFACPSCGKSAVVKRLDDIYWVSWGGKNGRAERVHLPELPRVRQQRFRQTYGLNDETASKLTSSKEIGDFFEAVVAETGSPDIGATFTVDLLLGELRYRGKEITSIKADDVIKTVNALSEEDVTERKVTEIVREALDSGETIDAVFSSIDTEKTDEETVRAVAQDIIENETEAVEDYKSGSKEALNYLVGQLMSETGGSADAREARETFKQLLDKLDE